MTELALTPQTFAILNGLIEERIGICYSLADKVLLESKVATRALELGFDTLLDYYYYLRYDDATGSEFDLLTEALVVNETYFFREYDQLHAALSHFVLPALERGARPRIWSAACSTGEEPATIAMWLEQRGLLHAVDLVASDISEAALAVARRGQYRPRSLRRIPAGVAHEAWLHEHAGGWVLDARIRDAVQWRRVNLMDDAGVRALASFDLILCRNMLIYFRDEVARRVVNRLAHQLEPEGALLVGVSESLMRFDTVLRCEEHNGVFAYRKASEA